MTTRGTCPVCFRDMPVTGTAIDRHGWAEQGDRRVGQHGRAWHSGSCWGVGWPAFEVSAEGAREYVSRVLVPAIVAVERALARLRARPATLVYRGTEQHWSRERHKYVAVEWTAEIGRDEPARVLAEGRRVPSYDDHLAAIIAGDEAHLSMLRGQQARMEHAIKGWQAGALRDEQRVETVHYGRTVGTRLRVVCGSRSSYIRTTTDRSATTCSRCLAALARDDADQERRRAEEEDAASLTAWLAAHGPAETKKIKAGLGWDQKRLNRAIDLAERRDRPGRIDRDYATGRYSAGGAQK